MRSSKQNSRKICKYQHLNYILYLLAESINRRVVNDIAFLAVASNEDIPAFPCQFQIPSMDLVLINLTTFGDDNL